ncbi:MAG: ROK family protein [Acidimicrobiia bacterium]
MRVATGIDVGGTKTLGVIVDERGEVLGQCRRPTPDGAEAVLDVIVEVARELGTGMPLGVGVAGLVDRSGRWRAAPNVQGIEELDVLAEVGPRLDAPSIVVDNDATCATFAEWRVGAGRGYDDLVVAALGTGIGGGFVSGGALQRGANGFAGEFGHMVLDPSGPPCPCGRRGCWERYGSGAGLAMFAEQARRAGRLDPAFGSNEAVVDAAVRGDDGAVQVVAEVGWWVALGLANLTNISDPALIVIGGGLVDAGEVLLAPVRAAFAELLYAPHQRVVPPIVPAALDSRAGAIGAGLLVLADG